MTMVNAFFAVSCTYAGQAPTGNATLTIHSTGPARKAAQAGEFRR
jgi:hypothetical protein